MKHKRFALIMALMLVFSLFGGALSDVVQANGDGSTWNSITSGITEDLRGIWGSSSTDVFAVGLEGTILHYDGSTWSLMTTNTTKNLYGVWGSSASDVFAVGLHGTILHFDGNTWSSMTSGTIKGLYGVWGSSASDVFAVGNKAIRHYDGSTWKGGGSMSEPDAPLKGVWGSSSSDVYAVGSVGREGTILHYKGERWWRKTYISRVSELRTVTQDSLKIPQELSHNLIVTAIWGSSSSDIFAVGPAGTTIHRVGSNTTITSGTGARLRPYTGSNTTITMTNIKANLHSVWGSSSSDVFAVGDAGTILHYDGNTWEETNSGTTADLMSIWGSSSSDVFAVGSGGKILHYGDPRVTGVSIYSGDQGMTLDVVITGAYFTGATAVSFGNGITVKSFTIDSSTQITASISIAADAATGARDILVTTPAGTGTLAGSFIVKAPLPTVTKVVPPPTVTKVVPPPTVTKVVPPPTVTKVVPPPTVTGVGIGSGDQGMMLDVVITGAYFTGTTAVSFGNGITVNSFTVDSSTGITASISIATDAEVGARDISVTAPAGTGTLAGGFAVTVPPPTVTGVSIGTGNQGMTLDVVITGAYFTGATAVSFGNGITVSNFTVDSSTRITASISIAADAEVGARDILVTSPAGTGTLASGFTVAVPPTTVTTPAAEPTPTPPGGGLSCGRSPSPQASGLGDLALLLGVVLVCFGFTRFRRR